MRRDGIIGGGGMHACELYPLPPQFQICKAAAEQPNIPKPDKCGQPLGDINLLSQMSRLHNSLIVDSLGNFPWRPAVSSAAGWIMKMIFNVQVATGRQEREFRAPPAPHRLRHQLRTRAEGLPPPSRIESLPGATYAKQAGCRLIPSIESAAPLRPTPKPSLGLLVTFYFSDVPSG